MSEYGAMLMVRKTNTKPTCLCWLEQCCKGYRDFEDGLLISENICNFVNTKATAIAKLSLN